MGSSIQDVAKAAGVSVSTVSRSLTRPKLVSAKTRERVLRIAEELNFSLSRSAVALKSGRSLRVALLMSDHLRQWFNASVLEGLTEVFHHHGYDISIFQVSSIDERREFFGTLPVRRNADAVIVASFDIDDTEIAHLTSIGVPIIGINSLLTTGGKGFAATVTIDDSTGAMLAARHLISLGHRDIAYIRTDRAISLHFSVETRYRAFVACCRQAGIEPHVITIDENESRIATAVTQLMSLPEMPTAVACQEDGIALPLLFQLQRNGLSVPHDVSVIGYDDSTYAADASLTTLRQDPIGMARQAAEMTLELIEGHTPENPFRLIAPSLIVRSSTARPR